MADRCVDGVIGQGSAEGRPMPKRWVTSVDAFQVMRNKCYHSQALKYSTNEQACKKFISLHVMILEVLF